MNLNCIGCEATFEAPTIRGYCDGCIEAHNTDRKKVHAHQRPAEGVFADGKFTKRECPKTVFDPVAEKEVCGLCGPDEVEGGYGLGGGYGMGSYKFCFNCNNFLNFVEDYE